MERRARVLLVEDNPADQALTRRALEAGDSEGVVCELRVVSDGEEALDYLHGEGRYAEPGLAPRPDLVLLDLNMPKLSGREVLKRMKADGRLDTIPVVVLTTSYHEEDITCSYKLGCSSFINKPVDIGEFVAALRQVGDYWFNLVVLPK